MGLIRVCKIRFVSSSENRRKLSGMEIAMLTGQLLHKFSTCLAVVNSYDPNSVNLKKEKIIFHLYMYPLLEYL